MFNTVGRSCTWDSALLDSNNGLSFLCASSDNDLVVNTDVCNAELVDDSGNLPVGSS